jgi:hypothetical protein
VAVAAQPSARRLAGSRSGPITRACVASNITAAMSGTALTPFSTAAQ